MNVLQNFFKKSLRIGLNTNVAEQQQQQQHDHHRIYDLLIKLDKDEFTANDKRISGKLIIKTHDEKINEIAKTRIKFYDELSVQWEEYEGNTLTANTVEYGNYKKPFRVNLEVCLEPSSAVLVDKEEDATHKRFEIHYPFSFDIPELIHGSVNLPNASYTYFIEALFDIIDPNHHKHGLLHQFSRGMSHHNLCKTEFYLYNEIMRVNELALKASLIKPQINELQTHTLHIRVTLPKRAYFSTETIPITMEIDELEPPEPDSGHNLRLHKIVFKLYQSCKVYADEPDKKAKIFDYLIKQTTRKIHEKVSADSSKVSLVENFEIPSQLFSTTDRAKFRQFNNQQKQEDTTRGDYNAEGYVESNSRFFSGIRVDYKLVIEFWKNIMSHDSIVTMPIMIDPEE